MPFILTGFPNSNRAVGQELNEKSIDRMIEILLDTSASSNYCLRQAPVMPDSERLGTSTWFRQ